MSSPAPAQRVGPYELVASIGKGGMGEVWRARDTRLNRDVAIKFSSAEFSDRFQREAQAIAALNHPNICTLFDVGPNYLVMELIEGPTLADRIQEGAIPLDEALNIARQIADALDAAHEKGIVHRDLKPANIKMRPDGSVKVLDFGLAKAASEEAPVTADSPTLLSVSGMILGTAGYMSPEQAKGKTVDKRADIFAFGVVVYEMVTGDQLFRGETISESLASVIKDEPDWTKAPARAQRLLRKCLAKDPKKRLRDIGDWEDYLLPEVSAAPPLPSPLGNRAWISAAGVSAVIVATLSFFLWRASRPPERPLMRFDESTAPDTQRTPVGPVLAISRDGSHLAWLRSSTGEIEVRRAEAEKANVLAGTENATAPFFSPDGRWIGFFVNQVLKKVSVEGGSAVKIADVGGNPRGGGFWGEDGFIYIAHQQSPVMRVPENGGKPAAVTKIAAEKGEVSNRGAQLLPGGQAILFETSTDNNTWEDAIIIAQSITTGERRTLVQGGYFGRYIHGANPYEGHLLYGHADTLFAAPMDARRLELTGPAVPVLENVTARLNNGIMNLAFTDSGTLVYVAGPPALADKYSLAWVDMQGRTELMGAEPGAYQNPRFSPDGTRIAFTISENAGLSLAVYEWANNRMTRLPNARLTDNLAIWTPDGKHLVYRGAANNSPGIQWVRADGAGDPLLLIPGGALRPESFTPDGRHLAGQESSAIWTAQLDLTNPEHPTAGKRQTFLKNNAETGTAMFSPDGRWIAYDSGESGRPEVYVRPFPGPGGKWQISTAGGRSAFWSSDGRTLFFRGPSRQLMVVNYTVKADAFSPDPVRPWITGPVSSSSAMTPAPDGKRAVALIPTSPAGKDGPDTHIAVLLNFADELKRKAPAGRK